MSLAVGGKPDWVHVVIRFVPPRVALPSITRQTFPPNKLNESISFSPGGSSVCVCLSHLLPFLVRFPSLEVALRSRSLCPVFPHARQTQTLLSTAALAKQHSVESSEYERRRDTLNGRTTVHGEGNSWWIADCSVRQFLAPYSLADRKLWSR
jgi:hypothetical protein